MAKKTYQEKLAIRLNRTTLDRINIVLITNPENRKFAKNVLELFRVSDMSSYLEDLEKYVRVELAKKIAQLIIDSDISDTTMLKTLLQLEGKYESDMTRVFDEVSQYDLNPGEPELIDKLITNQLKYGVLKNNARKMIDKLAEVDTESFSDFGSVLKQTEDELGKIYKDLRKIQESINTNVNDLKLDSDSLKNFATKYLEEKRASDYKIRTGIQDFNTMLNGGFEKGKLYCFYAPKKSFKSGSMLNCCVWAKKHNSFDVSDGKRPVILYISMENTTGQTQDRLWSYYNGNDSDVSKYSPVDYIKKMDEVGLLAKSDLDARIDLLYRKNMTVSSDDILNIINDYEDKGEKVVFVVLDYIGRMRSSDTVVMATGVDHVILDAVSNELVGLAREKNVPVLTAAQMNRNAMETLDKTDGSLAGKMRATTKASSSNIQGSFKITQNVDFGIVVNLIENVELLSDMDYINGVVPKKEHFLYFKMTECRGVSPKISQFFVPFVPNNTMRVAEDIMLKKKLSFQNQEIEEKLSTKQLTNAPIVSGSTAKAKPIIID